MRRQYHFRLVGTDTYIWDVHCLVGLSRDLPIHEVLLSEIQENTGRLTKTRRNKAATIEQLALIQEQISKRQLLINTLQKEISYTDASIARSTDVAAALEEDVDAIGLSSLSGAHDTLFPKVRHAMDEEGLDDVLPGASDIERDPGRTRLRVGIQDGLPQRAGTRVVRVGDLEKAGRPHRDAGGELGGVAQVTRGRGDHPVAELDP